MMEDRKPSDESWTEKCNRLAAEEEAQEKARRNEPGMVKIQKSFTFDSMFGWVGKLKAKMKKPNNPKLPLLALSFLCLIFTVNCSVTSATKVGPDGVVSKFYNGAVGGKGGAVQGNPNGGDFVASFYDNEKSFRDGVIGLATYGVSSVIGDAFKVAQTAKTAQNAANQAASVANTATAANVSNTATTANLIKDVGLKGEVPISAIGLPASP